MATARPSLVALLAGAVAILVGVAVVGLLWRRPPPPPREPTPIELRAGAWRADPALPPGTADELVTRGLAALQADLPGRLEEARLAFRAALVRDPARLDAVAGLATAFADEAGSDEAPEGQALREADGLVAFALAQEPGRPDLLAARARLLLLVPSGRNAEAALTAARQAVRAAPADSGAALALGLARLAGEPAAAFDELARAADAAPADRRLRSATARAALAAGDDLAALGQAEARLALDADHPGMLELAATVELEAERPERAIRRLETWARLDPGSPLPAFHRARLAAQRDGDLSRAAALLDAALPLARGDFLAARILAHRAGVALAQGDEPGAARAVATALQRVPASAPARYQAARLAFRQRDRRALHEAVGVVKERCGVGAARRLAALEAELGSSTLEEASGAWQAVAAAAPRDPRTALEAGGALARLGTTGTALAVGRAALARDPLEGRLRRPLAECWDGPASLAEAAQRFEAIAAAEPSVSRQARTLAALAELLLGHTVAADRLAWRVVSEWPQAGEARLILAQVALDRGRPAGAIHEATAARELIPGGGPAHSVLARATDAAGRAADTTFEAALAEPATRSVAELALVASLAHRGRAEEARQVLQGLLAEEPDLGPARGLRLDLAVSPAPR